MSDYCGECALLDRKDCKYGNEYYCKKKGTRKKLDSVACSYIVKLDTKKNNSTYQRSGCYITTICCEILGMDDNCYILNTLRYLRDNYLIKDEKFYPLLQEYDQIGPVIANSLNNDQDKLLAAKELMYDLIPCCEEISKGNYEEAKNIYLTMVLRLKLKYELLRMNVDLSNINPIETLGHGRIKKLEY